MKMPQKQGSFPVLFTIISSTPKVGYGLKEKPNKHVLN